MLDGSGCATRRMHRNKDLTETVMYRFELMHEPYLCFDLIASLLNIQPILAEMGVACPTRNDVEFYDKFDTLITE